RNFREETLAETTTPKSQLRREMGLWDVLLFNIAAVLGPRWIAAAAHNGTSSISSWVLAAVLFFLPTALIIVELSTRFPSEGGLYVWSKEAFGDFHGFVAGWSYWVYTLVYFPGLLTASVAISLYIGRPKSSWPVWNWGTVKFWSSIAFAFTGMELVCAMSEEVHEPRKNFPRAIYAAAALIALIYIIATVALLVVLPAAGVDVRNGVFQAI